MRRLLPAVTTAVLLACSAPPPVQGQAGGGTAGGGFAGGPGGGPVDGPSGGGFVGGCFAQAAELEPARTPPHPARAVSGGSLLVLDDGTALFADPDRDVLHRVDAQGVASAIALQENDEPGRVVKGPAGLAFVALRRAGEVAVIDLAGRRVAARLEACPAARGLAWVGRTSSLFVACATGELAQLELTVQGSSVALAARALSRPAPDLRDVLELPDGLLLTTFRDALVFKRSDDGTVTAQPGPVSTARTPMAMSSGGGAGGPPAQFDPHVAWRTVAASGGALMVHQHHQRGALGFGCSGYGGQSGQGVVRSVLSRLTASGVETLGEVPSAVLPVDLATSASGQLTAVAAAGSAVVWVRDALGGFTRLPMPGQPTSVAFQGERLWVAVREPATLVRVDDGQTPQPITLRGDSAESTGHTLFHRATSAGIACASCHPEAGEDGHTWVLPEGSRRTPTLRGALASTAPFHWGGEFPSLEALLSEVMVGRMRGVPQSPAREQALLAWMDAQPALPAPSWLDAEAVARGKGLFEGKAGCAGCHAGSQGTNNATVDVGTGAALQVPRLVELARRAPYFHDGRIPTLAGRFGPAGGGDRHGNVGALTAAELEALTTYLSSR